MSLLSEQDRQRIEAAVKVAEARTAGEIVTVVSERSHDYGRWRALVTAVATVLVASAIHCGWDRVVSAVPSLLSVLPYDASTWLIPFQLAIAAAVWWITGRAWLLRVLLPASVRTAAVRNRAKQAFLDHGVTETRDRSGVLIFLSELEHQVHILADRGIHERLGVETWQRHVRTIARAIAEDRAGNGIVEVVQEIGEELATAFPARDDDENELPDGVHRTPE